MLSSSYIFAQTYGYDREYQAQLDKIGVEIDEERKEKVREEIKKYANLYLSKSYKYNEKVLLTHPVSKYEKSFNFDCSGFIAAVYWTCNIAVFEKQAILDESGVKTIYATLEKYKKLYRDSLPKVGDIVMFDRTTSDTKKLTHAGIVVDIDAEDGTVTYVHASTSKGLVFGYMNLKYPDLANKDGKVINSYLKRGGGVEALASRCFNAYGTILDVP